MPMIVQYLLKYGLAAIGAWLVYVGATNFQADMHEQTRLMREHASQTQEMIATQRQLVDLQRQTCVITAGADENKRDGCFYAGRPR